MDQNEPRCSGWMTLGQDGINRSDLAELDSPALASLYPHCGADGILLADPAITDEVTTISLPWHWLAGPLRGLWRDPLLLVDLTGQGAATLWD